MSQNCNAIHIVICITLMFIALSIACAVWIGRRRRTGIGQVAADPFSVPFGEMPGFSAEQLARIAPVVRYRDPLNRSFATRPIDPIVGERIVYSAGLALRPRNADGGQSVFPSWLAAIRNFWKALRHA